MSIVRSEIKLSELDIKELRLRKAITGAMLFEISGQDAGSKASRLAERMGATLKELSAKVTMLLLDYPGGGSGRRCRGRGLPLRLGQFGSHTLRPSGPQVGVAALPADSGQENQRKMGRPIGK